MWEKYLEWHKKKNEINNLNRKLSFHVREVWFCYLGINIGYEQNGDSDNFLRPVLILRKFNNRIFWAIPLTKTIKQSEFYFNFELNDNSSVAILSQVRLMDSKRLVKKIGYISKCDFKILKQNFRKLIS